LSNASNVKTLALMMRHERKDFLLTMKKKNQELLNLKKCGREVKIGDISSEETKIIEEKIVEAFKDERGSMWKYMKKTMHLRKKVEEWLVNLRRLIQESDTLLKSQKKSQVKLNVKTKTKEETV